MQADPSGTCLARSPLEEHHAVEDYAKASRFFAHPGALRVPLAVGTLARLAEELPELVIGYAGGCHLLAERFQDVSQRGVTTEE